MAVPDAVRVNVLVPVVYVEVTVGNRDVELELEPLVFAVGLELELLALGSVEPKREVDKLLLYIVPAVLDLDLGEVLFEMVEIVLKLDEELVLEIEGAVPALEELLLVDLVILGLDIVISLVLDDVVC